MGLLSSVVGGGVGGDEVEVDVDAVLEFWVLSASLDAGGMDNARRDAATMIAQTG